MFSKFFIDRPIFSAVISIIITIAGLVAMLSLPIAQYPNITPPQIQVSTTYPGANAETVSQNVASPIELQVNGADGMLYMYSTNTAGNMTLSIYFDINKDPALAQTDVLNRVNTALPQILAEELDADWSKVVVEQSPHDAKTYGNPGFGGGLTTLASRSVSGYHDKIR
ncbi:MAG: efflux RND transporter permease subunit, partial [Fluviibacter sp.]